MKTLRLALAIVALMVAACTHTSTKHESEGPRRPEVWEEHVSAESGYTVALPEGWMLAPETLTPHLGNPSELLSIGTYGLRPGGENCAQVPVNALEDLGATDAFASIYERRRGHGFVARPEHLESLATPAHDRSHLEAPDCLEDPDKPMSMWWFSFADGGRGFYALVALGPEASSETRATLWEILDRVDFT